MKSFNQSPKQFHSNLKMTLDLKITFFRIVRHCLRFNKFYLIMAYFTLILLFLSNQSTAQSNCCNILTNGNFESGNSEFTSGLPQNCACTAGSYCIGSNFQVKCLGWPPLNDHTGGGNFLIIDGLPSSPVDVWKKSTPIVNGTKYCISFWVASVYNTSFDLGLTVNGILVPGAIFTIQQSTAYWQQFSFTWTGTTGNVIAIRQMTGGGERDFGLDDIEFGSAIIPNFNFQNDMNCGMIVSFLNQSTGPAPLTYSWDFDDPNSAPNNTSTLANPSHTFSDCGSYQVCLTVTRGNCTEIICKTVSANDNIPPIAVCLGNGVVLNSNCMATITPGLIDGGSTDNCKIQSMSVSPSILTGCGYFPVTLTVTDLCGNSSSCSVHVQTIETVPPVITCPPNLSVNANPKDCSIVVNGINWITALDNCGFPTVNYAVTNATQTSGTNDASGVIFNQGVSTVTYTATDNCTNTSTCSFTVTVSCKQEECICTMGGSANPNLVVNGNFSSGNAGFTSGLTYSSGCGTGLYGINSNFISFCSGWPTLNAHSAPNFLILDGKDNGNQATILWKSQVNLTPQTEYCFSFWWASAFSSSTQSFPIEVLLVDNGNNLLPGTTPIGQTTIAQIIPAVWQQSSFTWNTNGLPSGNYQIAIRQLSGDIHRDFGIDDICFTKIRNTCTADFNAHYNGCGLVTFNGFANGTPGYTFAWDFGDPNSGVNNTSSLQNPTHLFSSGGLFTITLVITDATGCTATYSSTINIPALPTASISGNTTVCSGQSTTLTASGGVTYLWSPGGSTSSTITVTPTILAHTYTVTATDANGCTATATVNVSIQPTPGLILNDQIICRGQSTTLTAVGGFTYLWNTTATTASIYVSPASTTSYTVTATGTNGCTASKQVTVFVRDCDCPGSLLTNGSFALGIQPGNLGGPGSASFWSPIFTPQVVTSDGHGQLGCIQMWGNQVIGEGIEQAVNFQAGCQYKIEFSAKYLAINSTALNPQIRFRATSSPGIVTYNNYGAMNPPDPAEQIGNSPVLTSNWNRYSITWTAPSVIFPLNNLVATVWNNSTALDPLQTSWIRLDSICVEKLNCMGDLACGPFVNLGFAYEKGQFISANCGDTRPIDLHCPIPGQNFYFSGEFTCTGTNSSGTAPITWELWNNGSPTGIIGSTLASPYFGIQLFSSYFTAGGIYELRINGHCGNSICPCTIRFKIPPCPDPCICDSTIHLDVSSGFYQGFLSKYCRMCFTPIALKDCDRVEWIIDPIDSINVNPAGTSFGNNTFCFSFSISGTYTITMHVIRQQADGKICEAKFSKTISVNCGSNPACKNSVLKNPEFNKGGAAGPLGSGGNSDDWVKVKGNPMVKDTSIVGDDDWSIMLTGNDESYDVIRTDITYCLERDSGRVSLRAKAWNGEENEPGIPISTMLFINFVRGDSFPTFPCTGDNCLEVACLEFPVGTEEWVEFEFDYDLRKFNLFDGCNGSTKQAINFRPVIYVGNLLKDDQGNAVTHSRVVIDKFCLNGKEVVPTINTSNESSLRIYPNPNSGDFTMKFDTRKINSSEVQIIDLNGRILQTETLQANRLEHTLSITALPTGVYLVKIIENGIPLWIEKIVKQ